MHNSTRRSLHNTTKTAATKQLYASAGNINNSLCTQNVKQTVT